MHGMAIIIKKRTIEDTRAYALAGDCLLQNGDADYYKIESDGWTIMLDKERVSLKEFVENYDRERGYYSPVPIFIIIDEEDLSHIEDFIIPCEFWEFYDLPLERKELLKLYGETYHKYVKMIIKKLLDEHQDDDSIEVIAMDYHF